MVLIHETVRMHHRHTSRIRSHEKFVLPDAKVPQLRLSRLLTLPNSAVGGADEHGEVAMVVVVRIRG